MAIGYACITLGVYQTTLHRIMAKNVSEEKLREITKKNLEALDKMIDFNRENEILLFRISSDVIPFASHPLNTQRWWEEHQEQFDKIGDKIAASGMRVSMHPGQYTILNSPHQEVVERAVEDLIYHERFLTALKTDCSHKLILHVGGIYGDKSAAANRFIYNYNRLSDAIKSRLVLENDERCYGIEEVYNIGKTVGAPVVFDVLHHHINPSQEERTVKEWIELCSQTWGEKDGVPKIHYSQQQLGGRVGAHSQTITIEEFLNFYISLKDMSIDIMLEVKDKNLSAIKCSYTVQPHKVLKKSLEKEWARYKYLVLSQSALIYQQMGQLMKMAPEDAVKTFYTLTEQAQVLPLDRGACQNAALHIWGYFKKICTESEKKNFHTKLERFAEGKIKHESIKKYLWKIAEKYEQTYLLESYYFIEDKTQN